MRQFDTVFGTEAGAGTLDFFRLLFQQPVQSFAKYRCQFREEHVAYSECSDFDDAFGHIKYWLEVVYMRERIHQALDQLTPLEFEIAARAKARYPLLSLA
jgi:hypothetical protein